MGRQGHFSNNEMDLKDIDVILTKFNQFFPQKSKMTMSTLNKIFKIWYDCDIPKTVFFLNNYAILIGLNQTDNLWFGIEMIYISLIWLNWDSILLAYTSIFAKIFCTFFWFFASSFYFKWLFVNFHKVVVDGKLPKTSLNR